ncbi:Tn3 family transposase [Streptomyces coacervatus]|uniref:Tn3 family transposase n=1 Tax=Streptomyces coacervatus TaxID=647381 RepID=UPI0023DCD7D4|nr:Tn3 family transposase [Streptomyces coacervatus]MDF2270881.1 Tn3 family transposase [Streptomyces coacervatus]
MIFHNTLDIAEAVRQLLAEGRGIDPLDLALISPYLTEHIMRFGENSTYELGITPDDYDAQLDVSVRNRTSAPAAGVARLRRCAGRTGCPADTAGPPPILQRSLVCLVARLFAGLGMDGDLGDVRA